MQISSVAPKRGVPYTSPYSAAKADIVGFTSALRAELWATGVHLSIVYPPTVDTPIYDRARSKLDVEPKPARAMADPLRPPALSSTWRAPASVIATSAVRRDGDLTYITCRNILGQE